jgi:hypothetical protein
MRAIVMFGRWGPSTISAFFSGAESPPLAQPKGIEATPKHNAIAAANEIRLLLWFTGDDPPLMMAMCPLARHGA